MLYKTWIELNKEALKNNINYFRNKISKKTRLWSVVKSNAYGHGIGDFSSLADKIGVDGFCVDSVFEGLFLRKTGIKKPILVLGPTLPNLLKTAAENEITVTISNKEALSQFLKVTKPPNFHLKIDTGMHRQGFYPQDLSEIIFKLKIKPEGIYTHFASAKDINYPTYTEKQFSEFLRAVKILTEAGFKNIIKHAAASGATLINKKYHLDAVRVGIGLFGLWPSKELEIQLEESEALKPVLSWKTIISEIKDVKAGSYIGYDLIERVRNNTKVAIIPIGYWHGLDRGLSNCGEVLINGCRARILGRVSMDLTVVDVSGIDCAIGDQVVVIGQSKNQKLSAEQFAGKIGTSHYEVITRINPLIKRIVT